MRQLSSLARFAHLVQKRKVPYRTRSMTHIITASAEETADLAARVLRALPSQTSVIALVGDLGAGKTTFAQGLLRACGAPPPYPSPTFTIMNEYPASDERFRRVVHCDVYRVGVDDIDRLGWEEVLTACDILVIVEWADRVASRIPSSALHVACAFVDETHRSYAFSPSHVVQKNVNKQ